VGWYRGVSGSSSDAESLFGNVVDSGVGIGEEICIFFRLGDLRAERMEDDRECDFSDFPSSSVRTEGRREGAFSSFFSFGGEPCRCGPSLGTGPTCCNCGGRGISFTFMPAALAASCCITWAYISSRSRCSISRSASIIRVSKLESTPTGEIGDPLIVVVEGGKTYGFRISFSGDGQEKFRGPPGI
jgi:hypothetical protein